MAFKQARPGEPASPQLRKNAYICNRNNQNTDKPMKFIPTQLRHITLLTLFAAFALAADAAPHATIVVFSDCHTLAPDLIAKDSKPLAEAAENDMRLTPQSAEILRNMVERTLEIKPQLVLVTGDLTSNGEELSHRYVASQLERLRTHGIKVFVVPGNHDISNPYAKSYGSESTKPTSTVTRDGWVRIYRNMGYDPSIAQLDTASLSFSTEAVPGLVLLGIDTNRDEENLLKSRGDTTNAYHTAGRIKPATLHWLADRAREARIAGKKVIAMCHHHVVEHFDSERALLKKYVISNSRAAIDTFTASGVHLLLTGHLHVTDAARAWNSTGTDSLTELATGSLVTYPLNYRIIKVNGSNAQYTTGSIGDQSLTAQAHVQIERTAPAIIKSKASGLFSKVQDKMKKLTSLLNFGNEEGGMEAPSLDDLDAAVDSEMGPMATQGLLLVLEGNEGRNGSSQAMDKIGDMFNEAIGLILPGFMGGMGEMMTGELYPRVKAVASSLLEDRNCVGTEHETVVDDHEGLIRL